MKSLVLQFLKILVVEFLEENLPVLFIERIFILDLSWMVRGALFAFEEEIAPIIVTSPGRVGVLDVAELGPVTGIDD